MICKSGNSKRVAVLAGGESAKHTISLASGASIAAALSTAGHEVTCLDPRLADDGLTHNRDSRFEPVLLGRHDWRQFDSCFLALHGGAGEDGRIQHFFETRGIRFSGPSAASARLAMSKLASKARFRACGVPTVDGRSFCAATPPELLVDIWRNGSRPVVVKPDSQGSSLGVCIANSPDEIVAGVEQALRFDRQGLIEPYLPGREFTVAVVDREPLPLVEIHGGTIFSYATKYETSGEHFQFPDDLSAQLANTIAQVAVAAAAALDTRGLVRVDVRLDNANQPYVLELNAIPGMTAKSLAPAAAQRAGIGLPDLCHRLLD